MDFDATAIGFNEAAWDYNFMIPVLGRLLMAVVPDTYMLDLDMVEILHNFRLYSVLSKYYGVDLGPYFQIG